MANKKVEEIFSFACDLFLPEEPLPISQWVEKNRYLSSEGSASPGLWRNDRTPYLTGIMEAAQDPGIKEIVVMSSAQVGKSELLNNILAFYIACDPCPILFFQPTIQMAESYSRDRIAPMLRDSDTLNRVVDIRSRISGNTLLHKKFPGGSLSLSGANSPASLASRPVRLLLLDELDRMNTTKEGDPVSLAEKRTITFQNRLIVKVSTPTISGLSRIEREYDKTDKRKFFCICPICGHLQVLEWAKIKWKNSDPGTAFYECARNQCRLSELLRREMIMSGKWGKTEQGLPGVAGFWLSELYSCFRSMSDIVQDFLQKKDNPETLMTFVNCSLGESFEMSYDVPEIAFLLEKREQYRVDTLPERTFLVTCGVDVQQDRLCYEIVAWGPTFETYSLDYGILYGNTEDFTVWKELDKVLLKPFSSASGNRYIAKVAVDSGFNTKTVKAWASGYPFGRLYLVHGKAGQKNIIGTPSRVDVPGKIKVKSYPVGIDELKRELYAFLRQTKKKDDEIPFGLCHFPSHYTEDYFLEITAEKLVKDKKRGAVVLRWKKIRERNEALDCRIYARAAAYLAGLDHGLVSEPVDSLSPILGNVDKRRGLRSEATIWQ